MDGPLVSAIPELAANVLNKDYASLVDVIHTNGAIKACIFCTAQRAGALRQLGHMDFYPDGGSVQRGCLFGIDARPGGIDLWLCTSVLKLCPQDPAVMVAQ